jgi:cell division protein FtsQ
LRFAAAAAGAASWRRRLAVLVLVLIAGAAGYFLWLRDSSFVAINDVEVVGVRGPERPEIVSALTSAAEDMTTLHVDRDRLETIGGRFATVKSMSIDPNVPHGLRIEVVERTPVLIAHAEGDEVSIAGDGTVLPAVEPPDGVPTIELDRLPQAAVAGEPLELALVAGAAPASLLPLIDEIAYGEEYGVELMLEGVPVRFGTAERAADKWEAAAAVLADPKLEAVTYIDVRVPERPAVGGAAASPLPTDTQL